MPLAQWSIVMIHIFAAADHTCPVAELTSTPLNTTVYKDRQWTNNGPVNNTSWTQERRGRRQSSERERQDLGTHPECRLDELMDNPMVI